MWLPGSISDSECDCGAGSQVCWSLADSPISIYTISRPHIVLTELVHPKKSLRPFQSLLIDVVTTYETLQTQFPKLYSELEEVDPQLLLSPNQVLKFVSAEVFKKSLSEEHLLRSLFSCTEAYKEDVVKILKICLAKFCRGFDKQKGAIFCFEETQNKETGCVLKITDFEVK